MALTAPKIYSTKPRNIQSYRVKTGVTIFNGALVALNVTGADTGLADNWSDPSSTARDHTFAGLARVHDQADGKVVGDGAKEVEVDISGVCLQSVVVTGVAGVGDVGALVYASDENTFTLTATVGAQPVGYVSRHRGGSAATVCDVQLFSQAEARAGKGFDIVNP